VVEPFPRIPVDDRLMKILEEISMKWPPQRERRVLKRVLALASLMLCAILLMPGRAHAQCTQGTLGTETLNFSFPATATIPRDAPLGTTIGTPQTITTSLAPTDASKGYGVNCTSSTTYSYANILGGGAASSSGIIPTGIPGIAYKVTTNATPTGINTASGTLAASIFTVAGNSSCTTTPCFLTLSGPGKPVTLTFINTGQISGTKIIPAGEVFRVTVGPYIDTDIVLANSIQVIGQTCAITTPSIPVTLGNIKSSVFTATGTKSPAVPFNIGLDCTGVATNVGITFTDNTNIGNTTNILSLSPSTGLPNATGVGIQIVRQQTGTAVTYGPDSPVVGNVNQIMLGASNSSTQNYAFTGQYISTATKVTAGPANGVATFTMSYQ
jgi:type 1 fimbria pilin